jgi:hypothetical protein
MGEGGNQNNFWKQDLKEEDREKTEKELWGWNRRDWEKEGKKLKRDEEAYCRPRKMEGIRIGPTNAVRHHGEEKEEEVE